MDKRNLFKFKILFYYIIVHTTTLKESIDTFSWNTVDILTLFQHTQHTLRYTVITHNFINCNSRLNKLLQSTVQKCQNRFQKKICYTSENKVFTVWMSEVNLMFKYLFFFTPSHYTEIHP